MPRLNLCRACMDISVAPGTRPARRNLMAGASKKSGQSSAKAGAAATAERGLPAGETLAKVHESSTSRQRNCPRRSMPPRCARAISPMTRNMTMTPMTRKSRRSRSNWLLKLQAWMKETGKRLVIVFEGRDGAGKGGAQSSASPSISIRAAAVSLPCRSRPRPKPANGISSVTPPIFPTKGEDRPVCDRSWYNRSGVERVFGFCETGGRSERFLMRSRPLKSSWSMRVVVLLKLFPYHRPRDADEAPAQTLA